jgi:hypothetical protein
MATAAIKFKESGFKVVNLAKFRDKPELDFAPYQGCILEVRLKTANGKLNLTHNQDGAFDRHLLDNPGENTVYSITSKK